jgi:hypothetical protein
METRVASLPQEEHCGPILLDRESTIYQHIIRGHFTARGIAFERTNDGKEPWKILSQEEAPKSWGWQA